ncbi:MAG: hypothetical protein O2999_11570 [Nitrospirae bacterium]|nr:hypothetical protein [Nitrospirota bacterium]
MSKKNVGGVRVLKYNDLLAGLSHGEYQNQAQHGGELSMLKF